MSGDYSFLLISEPYVGSNAEVHPVQGENVFQLCSSDRVKACVITREGQLDAILCAQYSTSNLAVIEVQSAQRKLIIASVYIEPDVDQHETIKSIEVLPRK